MNISLYNHALFKGNINIQFFLWCLKRNFKLFKYIFINTYYFLLSFFFYSKRDIYGKKKYNYLRDISNVRQEINKFYKKKNRIKLPYNNNDIDIIIDKIPEIFIKDNISKKKIGLELDKNFDVNFDKYYEKKNSIKLAETIFLGKRRNFLQIRSKKIINSFGNVYIYRNKSININIIKKIFTNKLFYSVILALLITIMSFFFTQPSLTNMQMFNSYFEIKLFMMNFIPIFIFILLLYSIVNKLEVSYLIVSFIVIILGIANQTKLTYRDDVVKFSDLGIIKEAFIMSNEYGVIIKKYTIIFIFISLIIFILIRRFVRPNSKKTRQRIINVCFCVLIILILFSRNLYFNEKIHNVVGDKSLINKWIATRQSQIRGLVYPFIYSSTEEKIKKPENYSARNVENLLNNFKYENIEKSKKVNIIAIMLESYNDFSKFESVKFKEDIYKPFHNIAKKSISGNLVSKVFGGGTIDTEWSFLTGYNKIKHFRSATNSYVNYFKEQGYKTVAMHPIFGSFYNRITAYNSLGFDKYHYYENVFSKTKKVFFNDYEFFDYIIKNYEINKSSDNNYFNFAVTYQNHGPYTKKDDYKGDKYIYNENVEEKYLLPMNIYFDGIKKTSLALERLINHFEKEEDPFVIILFGDHNPSFGKNNEAYTQLGIDMDTSNQEGFANYYEVPYIIFANNSAKKTLKNDFVGKGRTIGSFLLFSEVFDYCGYSGNEFNQYLTKFSKNVQFLGKDSFNIENGEFIRIDNSKNVKAISEYNDINYYKLNQKYKQIK